MGDRDERRTGPVAARRQERGEPLDALDVEVVGGLDEKEGLELEWLEAAELLG